MGALMPYLWYPLFLSGAITAFFAIISTGVSPALAAYGPIITVGVSIVVLERLLPERIEWRPRFSDVKADAAFMLLVQVILPRILIVLAVLAISTWAHAHKMNTWWPHKWPLAIQIVLMVITVDFLRYWLHRACHHYDLLWRLHEVHHSPDILYTLNVGRFHPFEKVLHFSLDTVPFLLLGAAPEVIAGYFYYTRSTDFFSIVICVCATVGLIM